MNVVIPAMNEDNRMNDIRPSRVCFSSNRTGLFKTLSILFLKESEGLLERWRHRMMDQLIALQNKEPVWNDGKTHCHPPWKSSSFTSIFRNSVVCSQFSRSSHRTLSEELSIGLWRWPYVVFSLLFDIVSSRSLFFSSESLQWGNCFACDRKIFPSHHRSISLVFFSI